MEWNEVRAHRVAQVFFHIARNQSCDTHYKASAIPARQLLMSLSLTCAALVFQSAHAADHQIIAIDAGQREDVYFEINLSGKVYLSIHAPAGGESCADFWWIKWPFGNIQSLGRLCNSAEVPIPGLSAFALSAKLRVGGAKQPLKIVASANESVDHSVTVSFP